MNNSIMDQGSVNERPERAGIVAKSELGFSLFLCAFQLLVYPNE